MPANTDRDAALRRVYQDARAAGLDDEGARVAVAIAITEAGYGGAQGDQDIGGSRGTFQFYFGGGMGNAYARAHGISEAEADRRLAADPHAGNRWALEGYLGQAIREGQQKGLHGADLATYAQRYGQRSVSPERSGANYQTVAMEGGGSVDPQRPAAQGPQDIFDRVVRAKGDPISIRPAPGQETVDVDNPNARDAFGDPVAGQPRTTKGPNPNPWYRYTFADGTYLDLQTPGGQAENIQIKGGTALASTARADQPPTKPAGTLIGGQTPNEQYIVIVNPDGSVSQQPNPNYVPPKPAASAAGTTVNTSTSEPSIVTRQPDGSLKVEPNPNYVAPKPGRSTHTVGGRAFTLDDNGNVVSTVDLRSPQQIQKEGIDLQTAQVDLQGKQRDLLPKQQQILQGHLETVKYVQGMLERGEIDQAQADAYVQMSKNAAESALRGTTPFQEAQDKRSAERQQQQLGKDLLNQRLVSGAGLASSLMQAATNNSIMLRPGQQSLGIDPLAGLGALLGDLQGGPEVAPFARGLLTGAQQGPPSLNLPNLALPAGL